jgi:hypothetical protein
VNYRSEHDGFIINGDWRYTTFKIVEERTKLVIKDNLKNYEAAPLLKLLNNGGGFDGHTPAFLLEPLKLSA